MNRVNIATFILDDDEDILELIQETIDKAGITNYRLFTNERLFLDGLNEDVHVCVIDHLLEVSTGLDILKEIKKKNKRSFIIVYTGFKKEDTIIDYLNNNADKWVDKNKPNHLELLTEYLKDGLIEAKDRIDFMAWLKQKADQQLI